MSIRDDIISIKNGLITLGNAIDNLSVHGEDSEQIVNSAKTINFKGKDHNSIYGKGLLSKYNYHNQADLFQSCNLS